MKTVKENLPIELGSSFLYKPETTPCEAIAIVMLEDSFASKDELIEGLLKRKLHLVIMSAPTDIQTLEACLEWIDTQGEYQELPRAILADAKHCLSAARTASLTERRLDRLVFLGAIDLQAQLYLKRIKVPVLVIIDYDNEFGFRLFEKSFKMSRLVNVIQARLAAPNEYVTLISRRLKRSSLQTYPQAPTFTDKYYNPYHAAIALADEIKKHAPSAPLLLGVDLSGAKMAIAIANELDLEYDIMLIYELAHPAHPLRTLATINEYGGFYLNYELREKTDFEELEKMAVSKGEALRNSRRYLQGNLAPISLSGRNVVIIDDGVVSGYSMLNAIIATKEQGAREAIAAAPFVREKTEKMIRLASDRTLFLEKRKDIYAVSQFYEQYRYPSLKEIRKLIKESKTKPQILSEELSSSSE